jgi:hypothetical protein
MQSPEARLVFLCEEGDLYGASELLESSPHVDINARVRRRDGTLRTPLMGAIRAKSKAIQLVSLVLSRPGLRLGRVDEKKRTDFDHALMVSPYPYGLIERIVCHPTCTSDLVNYGSQSFCAMSTLLLGSPERLQEFLGACRRAGIRPPPAPENRPSAPLHAGVRKERQEPEGRDLPDLPWFG